MDTPKTPYDVHQRWQCSGDTKYYCKSCLCDLCLYCKEKHLKDFTTIAHYVVTYRKKHTYKKKKHKRTVQDIRPHFLKCIVIPVKCLFAVCV